MKKDAFDRQLEALFAQEPIEDNGFTQHIQRRIVMRLQIYRLALPIALVLGGVLVVGPVQYVLFALPTFTSGLALCMANTPLWATMPIASVVAVLGAYFIDELA